MAKLVQKSGYIQSDKAGGYMKYIATREGVEKLSGNGPVTKGQRELIQKLLHDFPDAAELFEYEDYCKTPTLGTASAFITMALDANLHEMNSESGYMSYIATRPRVERHGAHGLFSSAPAVDLNAAMSELEAHEGNVWTIIYSLRREDAARLEYDNADAWRTLLMMHTQDLARAMRIPVDHFRWYAAFHNEGHHPHIHMMVWSDNPKEGFLTREGIAAMRSKLTNTIFRDEMNQIYERKDVAYKDLVETAQDTMRELIHRMNHQLCDNPVIEEQMRQLVQALETTTGKKQYAKKYSARTVYSLRDLKTREDWNEWQANVLGAAILMPQKEIDLAMWYFAGGKKLINYEGVFAYRDKLSLSLLCRQFAVSKSAAVIRLRHLGYIEDRPYREYSDPLEVWA